VLLSDRVYREQVQTPRSTKGGPLDQHGRIHRTIPFTHFSRTRSNNTMHLVYRDTKGSTYDIDRKTLGDGTSSRTKHAMMPKRFVRLLMCVCPPLHPHDLFFDPHHPSHKKHRPTTKSLLSSSHILTTTNTPTHRTGNYMGACQSVSSPKLITLLRIGADS
jgi:hypothetical protein